MFSSELIILKRFEDFFSKLTNINEDIRDLHVLFQKKRRNDVSRTFSQKVCNYIHKTMFFFFTLVLIGYLYYNFIFVIFLFLIIVECSS